MSSDDVVIIAYAVIRRPRIGRVSVGFIHISKKKKLQIISCCTRVIRGHVIVMTRILFNFITKQ